MILSPQEKKFLPLKYGHQLVVIYCIFMIFLSVTYSFQIVEKELEQAFNDAVEKLITSLDIEPSDMNPKWNDFKGKVEREANKKFIESLQSQNIPSELRFALPLP